MASSKVPDLTDAGTLQATDNLYVARGVDGDHKTTPDDILAYVQASGNVDNPPTATQTEMETGTESALRSVSPLLVAQAIAALASTSGNEFSIRQITEEGAGWDSVRNWNNPTWWYSTSDIAVLPPLNATTGIRKRDRYTSISADPPVLLVVGDAASPTGVDGAIRARLENVGLAVTYFNEDVTAPSSGYALAILSESVSSNLLHSSWSTTTLPVLTGESEGLDTMRLLNDDANTTITETTAAINLTNGAHDATGDLSNGSVTVYTSITAYSHVAKVGLPAGATVIAEKSGDSTRATVVAYESGASLITGTAPARRAYSGHLFRADLWADDGEALFDSLVYWVAGWAY